ncbi:hypothetical protein RSAG8_08379, partial [Rhizoctonia solani AG-8 WAC10335]
MMLGVGAIVPLLVSTGFLLLLLVSLSMPIIKSISILSITANLQAGFISTGVMGGIEIGVWGYCVTKISPSIFGFNLPARAGRCSPTQLGYDLDGWALKKLLGLHDRQDVISYGLTFVLVLHPIACGFAFLALLFTLILKLPCRPLRFIPTMILAFFVLSAIASTVAFAIDLALITSARNKVREATKGRLAIMYGNIPWMMFGAMVVLWVATLGACCGTSVRSRRPETEKGPSQSPKRNEV